LELRHAPRGHRPAPVPRISGGSNITRVMFLLVMGVKNIIR